MWMFIFTSEFAMFFPLFVNDDRDAHAHARARVRTRVRARVRVRVRARVRVRGLTPTAGFCRRYAAESNYAARCPSVG